MLLQGRVKSEGHEEIRSPKVEGRKKSEIRNPKAELQLTALRSLGW